MVIGQDYSLDVERKVLSILKIVQESPQPVGGRLIARELRDRGVDLGERAVRYHLKLMDERGLTSLVGRDGREITEMGREELRNALVNDKVGFVISQIELLAFRTTFDAGRRTGRVVVNTSVFRQKDFERAKAAMSPAFRAGLCVSDLVALARSGEKLDEVTVPDGCIGLATVCSITVNGALLKAGIPMDSRFGGLLQMRNGKPLRFVEIINYAGSSLDPSEIFITSRMTSVGQVTRTGEGKVLANFREIPAQTRSNVEQVVGDLERASIRGLLTMGQTGEPLCGVPISQNRVGVILLGGLNPVAAAAEEGLVAEYRAMSGLMDYERLVSFWSL
ncbi:MAG: NrpR regulatory domain-containing protein [Dehalococcoidia bacterium]|nr:NrpR regulatory domain-containing protein [Dehalococcoidia bacterium]